MNNKKNITTNQTTTTGGPVTEQAPTPNETTANLPSGYCDGGFMNQNNTILKRAYVDTYAQQLAHMLVNGKPSMKAANFKSAFLADAKRSLKRNVSTEARLLCAASMLTSAKKLTATKKAPPVLRDMVLALSTHVKDDESFHALYTHLDAIYAELLDLESSKTKEDS